MGDLLKNMRSSQVFSVCGLPEIAIRKVKGSKNGDTKHEVELIGLDVFDPVTMHQEHRHGNVVPAWFLDTDYNELCFHVSQAFFPRTGAWDNLKKKQSRVSTTNPSGTTWPARRAHHSKRVSTVRLPSK